MPKIEYGYIPRQVLFCPPTDYSGKFRRRSSEPVLLRWNGGGFKRIKKLDPDIPTQVGNMDWGFTPASVRVRS
jgi:hypothetical protein